VQLRTLLLMVNMMTIVAALVILREFPQYAGSAFYVLLGWMVGSLVLLYGPWATRTIGGPRRDPTAGPAPTATGPLPSAPAVEEIPFCIYCAAPLTTRAPVCPACGHRTPYL